jgi:preprotein translocase subunit SecD
MFTRPLVSILMRTDWFSSGKPWTGLSPDRLGVKPAVIAVDTHHRGTPAAAATKES